MAVLAQMSFWQGLLGFGLVIMAGLLIIVILLQKGRGEGLAGAFGGSGGSSAFGAKTGDVFTWITVVLATLVVVLAIASNFVFDESPKAAVAAAAAADPGLDDAVPTDGAAPITIPAVVPAETGNPAGITGDPGATTEGPAGTPVEAAPAKQDTAAPGEGAAGGTEDPSTP